MAERVSQTVLQVAAIPTSNDRVSQTVLQVAAIPTSNDRVSQTVLQVAAIPTSNDRVSQTVLQVAAIPSYQNSVIASSHNNPGVTASSITFTKPTGTSNKNLIFAVISFAGDPGAANIILPSGFIQILYIPTIITPGSMGIYYKYAKGGEPSTYTFSWIGGNQIASGGMLTVTGPILKSPIGVTADNVTTTNTNAPATITLSPISTYSMIVEIFAWTGAQTFTSPTGPWSQQFTDSNATGMSTALSARNWDTGITTSQIGSLSGSPSSYIAASIEIQGLITPPSHGKKNQPVVGDLIHITGGKIVGNQVVFNHKLVPTLYTRMKRIGFPRKPIVLKTLISSPVVVRTSISVLKIKLMTLVASTINLTITLKKSINKTLKANIILNNTLVKQSVKTLKNSINLLTSLVKTRFVNLTSNIVMLTTSVIHGPSQLLIANVNLNSSTNLLKSIGIILTASNITIISSLLKTIDKFLNTALIITSIQIKYINKTLITNIISILAALVYGPSVLLTAIVDVGLGGILIKRINPVLNTNINLTSILSQFINITLISIVSLIVSVFKNTTNTLSTIINNAATFFKNTGINLVSDLISLVSILSKTDTALTIFLSTSIAISTSLLKQINQVLISNFIVFINTLIHSTAVTLIADVITSSTITKTVGKILKILTRVTAFLPGQHTPPTYNLYMPLHNSNTIVLYMSLLSTKLVYMSLNPATKSDIIIHT